MAKKITPKPPKSENYRKVMDQFNQLVLGNPDIFDASSANSLIKSMTEVFSEPLNALLKAEMDEHLGRSEYERSENSNRRNGFIEKTVSSSVGKLDIKTPRDRKGLFNPFIIPKRQRDILEMEELLILLSSKGTSQEDIKDIIFKLYNKSLDQAAISRITDRVHADLKEFQNRPLDKVYPFWYIDAIRFHSREDGAAKLVSVYVILGVDVKGYKHVIGLYIGENETSKEWLKFFDDLKQRGVERVLMVISDNLPGISEAINTTFPKAMIQKCVVHQVRNSLLRVSNYDMSSFAKDMKTIYNARDIKEAEENFNLFRKNWEAKYPRVIKSWTDNWEELTCYYQLPFEIRKMVYTTNVIENINRQIRRVTKTKSSFVNNKAILKIVYLGIMNYERDDRQMKVRNWQSIIQQLEILFDIDLQPE